MKIIIVVIIGVLIYVFLKVINTLFIYINKKYTKWTRRFNLLPAIEFFIWLIYIFWAIDFLFKNKFYYQYLVISLVFILVVFLAWFVVKDFIAGIVFKAQNDLQKNNSIQLGKTSGKIKSQHATHLKVETSSGQIVKIPYSKLNQEIISEASESTTVEEFKFKINVAKNKSKQDIEEKIRFLVINSPWSNLNVSPVIKFLSDNESTFTFEVLINTLNHKHMRLIEESITDQLSV